MKSVFQAPVYKRSREFADLASREGFNVNAYDDADEMVVQARDKYDKPTFLLKSEFEEQQKDLLGRFDVVTSNLVLCILEPEGQNELLATAKSLLKIDGTLVLSLCHPKYDYLPDSLVSKRFIPEGVGYADQFQYEKEIKENKIRFGDYHRPLEYYKELFGGNELEIIETKDSLVLGSNYSPDFIVFALKDFTSDVNNNK